MVDTSKKAKDIFLFLLCVYCQTLMSTLPKMQQQTVLPEFQVCYASISQYSPKLSYMRQFVRLNKTPYGATKGFIQLYLHMQEYFPKHANTL